MIISTIANKNFVTLSAHETRFITGETVNGDVELAKLTMTRDNSEVIRSDGEFILIRFRKEMTKEMIDGLTKIINDDNIHYILAPSFFASIDLSALPRKEKIVAFNSSEETKREKSENKIASMKLTLIW